jgi:hypothetical protein
VDYAALWVEGNRLPALVTTSPDGTPRGQAGVLPGAQVLLGGRSTDDGARNGGRVTIGHWFGADHDNSVEFTWWDFGPPAGAVNFNAISGGSPILARPFFNVSTGTQDAQLIAFPNVVAGQPGAPGAITICNLSTLDLGEIVFGHSFYRDCDNRINWLAGYRHMNFGETLSIRENIVSLDPAGTFPFGTIFNVLDQFATLNEFEGALFGAGFQRSSGCWRLDGNVKLGFGNVHQVVTRSGGTTVSPPFANAFQAPGFLVQGSNLGVLSRNEFGFLPTVELKLHWQVSDQFDFVVGYNFLFLTSVVRSGDQIDTSINSTQLPTALNIAGAPGNHPAPVFRDTSLWGQGITGGVELRF